MKLKTVYRDTPTAAFIDIVSIPGLPDIVPQYKKKDHEEWLRDVLCRRLPEARILHYNHEFGLGWDKHTRCDWNDLTGLAIELINELRKYRMDCLERPIIFICYSFGAFVLKNALTHAAQESLSGYREIVEATRGVLFIGCLNDPNLKDFEERVLRCAAVELNVSYSDRLIDNMRKTSGMQTMKDIVTSFKTFTRRFPIRTFFEQIETTYESNFFRKDKREVLCGQASSALGWIDHETLIPVKANHRDIVKGPLRSVPWFDSFIERLSDIAKAGLPSDVSSLAVSTEPAVSGDNSGGPLTTACPRTDKLPCYVTKPHTKASDSFVGRHDILESLKSHLVPRQNEALQRREFALCGLGGMGKTQIAVKFLFSNLSSFRAVLWAHADTQAKLTESLCLFAEELGLLQKEGALQQVQADARQLVQDWLAVSDIPILIIFDNADSSESRSMIDDLIPKSSKASIMITSRNNGLLGEYDGTRLEKMNDEDSFALLKRLTESMAFWKFSDEQARNREVKAARDLVERLGHHPLGIRQAAELLRQDNWMLSDFYESFTAQTMMREISQSTQQGSSKFTDSSDADYRHSLATVWAMHLKKLDQESVPDQKHLLNLMAFMDPDGIAKMVLKLEDNDPSNMRDDDVLAFMKSKNRLGRAKQGLLRSSLITEDPSTQDLFIHRLVQAYCQSRMKPVQQRQYFRSAVMLVNQRWREGKPHETHSPRFWNDYRSLLPHVQILCREYRDSLNDMSPLIAQNETLWDFPHLLYKAGWFCYETGTFASVEELLRQAETYIRQRSTDGKKRLLADIYGGIGALCTESNDFVGALENFNSQWAYTERGFADGELQRPDVIEVFGLGRLGNGYHGLKNYTEAEKHYRKCLGEWDRQKIPGDRRIFRTHLGTCLWLQGRLDEAEKTVEPMTRDWEDRTNFRTGQALFALGNIKLAQAEVAASEAGACKKPEEDEEMNAKTEAAFAEAERIHRQSWQLYHDVLGRNHHKTADALHKLACYLHRQRKYDEALKDLEAALKVYNTGPAFFKNEIARTTYKIGTIYQDKGDLPLGREKIDFAEKLRKEILPDGKWAPAEGEKDFDELVQFWTR